MIDKFSSLITKPKWYEFKLDFDIINWNERLDWCKEHFGPPGLGGRRDRKHRWEQQFNRIYFRDKEDYVLYTLRWGG